MFRTDEYSRNTKTTNEWAYWYPNTISISDHVHVVLVKTDTAYLPGVTLVVFELHTCQPSRD